MNAASRTRPRALYAAHGFYAAGGRSRYYADSEDAIIMTRPSLGDAEFGRLRERLRRRASAEAQQSSAGAGPGRGAERSELSSKAGAAAGKSEWTTD